MGFSCQLAVIQVDRHAEAKWAYVVELGPEACVCIWNNRLMLKEAALGMVLVQAEGAAPEALLAADMESCSILEAFDLLCRARRLTAICVPGNVPSSFLFVGTE